MRMIDADELKEHFPKDEDWEYPVHTNSGVVEIIDDAPTVDPVKYGHWETVDETEPRRYGCSVCKRLSWTEDNFCSYCGAKMEVVKHETD